MLYQSILQKLKVDLEVFRQICEEDVDEEHPEVPAIANLIYEFKCEVLKREKHEKALRISHEKYQIWAVMP